jgi:DNA-binding response OmpR family regulator
MQELEARLSALHRRAQRQQSALRLQVADLVLDEQTREVTRAGQRLHLGPIAFQLLGLLMRETHRVVKRAELERCIWQDDVPASDAALRTHIAYLRQVVDKPFDRELIHTVHGVGYRLTDQL